MAEETVSIASECAAALHKAGIPALSSGCRLEADVPNADRERASNIVRQELALWPGYGADLAAREIEIKNEWILYWGIKRLPRA